MTAVAFAMTDASAASVIDAQRSPAHEAGFALYVGLDGGVAERARLADLAQAVMTIVAELAPDGAVHSALALGARGSRGELVARLRDQLAAQIRQPTDRPEPFAGSASARAEVAWRSPHRTANPSLVVDVDAREVTLNGSQVALTFKELALLEYLLRAPHRAVSRDELLDSVWRKGGPSEGTRTIDVHVRRLREKLGGCLQIVTVRGVGYRCEPTPEIVLVGSGDAG